jgi:hypothetical protein
MAVNMSERKKYNKKLLQGCAPENRTFPQGIL